MPGSMLSMMSSSTLEQQTCSCPAADVQSGGGRGGGGGGHGKELNPALQCHLPMQMQQQAACRTSPVDWSDVSCQGIKVRLLAANCTPCLFRTPKS